MKKIIFFASLILLLVSCNENEGVGETVFENPSWIEGEWDSDDFGENTYVKTTFTVDNIVLEKRPSSNTVAKTDFAVRYDSHKQNVLLSTDTEYVFSIKGFTYAFVKVDDNTINFYESGVSVDESGSLVIEDSATPIVLNTYSSNSIQIGLAKEKLFLVEKRIRRTTGKIEKQESKIEKIDVRYEEVAGLIAKELIKSKINENKIRNFLIEQETLKRTRLKHVEEIEKLEKYKTKKEEEKAKLEGRIARMEALENQEE